MKSIETEYIDVIILCGGEGSRLRQVISDRPKPMADINGVPFLDILVAYLRQFGFRRFILCTGYMSDFIKKHYPVKDLGYEIVFSEENAPLDTGGAVKNAEKYIKSASFLIMNGDSFCPANLLKFFDFHNKKKALVSMVVVRSDNSGDYGSIILDESGSIVSFVEKAINQNNSYVNAGIYFFRKEIIDRIPPGRKFSLEHDLFPRLSYREFYGYVTEKKLLDIGTPERYEQAKRCLVKGTGIQDARK